jgi:RHS repeat-associated protein
VTTTYAYPAAGQAQPHAPQSATVSDSTGTRTQTYAYDQAGNTTRRLGASAMQQLTWNAEGDLATVTEGPATTSYVYDADGNRLIRHDAGGATLYLPDMEVRLAASSGQVTAIRYYSHAGRTVAMRAAGGMTWLLPDHQGTASLAIDAATQSVLQRRQTPFGGPRGSQPAWPTPRGFVGGTTDPTGLVHLGAREYDPSIGRFVSVDPEIDQSDPQQMEGYSYADNTPVTQSDPDGRRSVCLDPTGDCGNPTSGAASAPTTPSYASPAAPSPSPKPRPKAGSGSSWLDNLRQAFQSRATAIRNAVQAKVPAVHALLQPNVVITVTPCGVRISAIGVDCGIVSLPSASSLSARNKGDRRGGGSQNPQPGSGSGRGRPPRERGEGRQPRPKPDGGNEEREPGHPPEEGAPYPGEAQPNPGGPQPAPGEPGQTIEGVQQPTGPIAHPEPGITPDGHPLDPVAIAVVIIAIGKRLRGG